ncbi:MAG: lspA [Phycisphaerales bacterium]|nr:lspA [Phycisphaerales bacterium]
MTANNGGSDPGMSRRVFANFFSPLALSCFLLTAAIGLALDQWTKVEAFSRLKTSEWIDSQGMTRVNSDTYPFIPGWLHFHVTTNQGAVFGVGQGKRMLFIAVSLAAVVFIGYLFTVSGRQRGYQIILGMLMAGVLGNLYDRAKFGYVRDMILALPGKYVFGHEAFPWIFNIADSLLCTGVALMILHSFFHSGGKSDKPATAGQDSGGPRSLRVETERRGAEAQRKKGGEKAC